MIIRSLILLFVFAQIGFAVEPSPQVLDEIRQEATRSNQSEVGRPLPLAAHWNCSGAYKEGFTPTYQLQLLGQERHVLPWLDWPPTDTSIDANFKSGDPRRQKYIDDRMKDYEPVIKELARLRMPLSFLATQWEQGLSYDKTYFELPPEKNPNVIGADSKVQRRVCPFGPVEPWRQIGRTWTDNLFLKQIQAWYPDPPLVLLISNNEHGKLQWTEVETSPRYLEKYGQGKSDDFKRKVVGDGWIERYTAMQEGLRAGLVSDAWKKNVKFVAYEAFPPVHFGRWSGWKEYSLYSPGRLDPLPFCWDGGSPSYYLHNWMALTDYTIWSPQVESMNWVVALDEVHRSRPEFWFELSTWDGNTPGTANDKRMFYARQGQLFTPARYEGFVQYGMWLTRPRVVRDFRSYLESVEYAGPYFEPILDAVDRVYREPTLQKFWRKGTLVANRQGKHPFQADIPPEYADIDRWFLLDTNLTPQELRPEEFDNAKPPARQTEVAVFPLALILGTAPNREWLVFAHAPRQARLAVEIRLPDYGPITVDVPQSGSFFHVTEGDKRVRTIHQGGPASLRLEAPQFVDTGSPAAFAVSEKYNQGSSLNAVRWEFGDGASAKGDQTIHRFAKPGQYIVKVAGLQNEQEVVHQEVPIFVGITPEQNLVCRLLMKGALQTGMKSWIWLSTWDKVEYHFIPDAAGAGNLGFLAGGAWVEDDVRGRVLELNGNRDRVEINNSPDINTAADYPQRTIAFWFRAIKPAAQLATPNKPKEQRQTLFEEGGSGSGINVYLDGQSLYAGAWNQGKGNWLQNEVSDTGAWHHVTLVLRRATSEPAELTSELYLDGQKVAEGKTPTIGPHVGDINLGRCGNTRYHDRAAEQPAHYFAGRLDDFRLLNRALSAAEVMALAKLTGDAGR